VANELEISILNPLNYREITSTQAAQYNSRHIDSFLFKDVLYSWQAPACFVQPFQLNDTLRQQVVSGTGPVSMRLYPHTDGPFITVAFNQKQQDRHRIGRYIFESNYALSNLGEGFYRPTLVVGGVEKWEGEWLWIKEKHEDSLLVEYFHTDKKYGFHFLASGMQLSVRTFGSIDVEDFNFTEAIYTDEEENSELLNSVAYDLSRFYINDHHGTTTAWAKKFSRILGCNELKIDGRFYTKSAEGATFEKIDSEAGRISAKKGWSILLRNRFNKQTFTSIDEIQAIRQAGVVYHTGMKAFGPGSTDAGTGTAIAYEGG
jgi:hypothetical protein